MTEKQFLREGRNLRQRIRDAEARMQRAQASAREAEGLSPDAAQAWRAMAEDYAREVEGLREWMRTFHDVERRIQETRYRDVLKYVWLDGFSLVKAARRMGYSYEHTKRLHRQAVRLFGKIYQQVSASCRQVTGK